MLLFGLIKVVFVKSKVLEVLVVMIILEGFIVMLCLIL